MVDLCGVRKGRGEEEERGDEEEKEGLLSFL